MPTITIKNGKRTLKLTKREIVSLEAARLICSDLSFNYDELEEDAHKVVMGIGAVLAHVANGAPAETKAPA